MPAPATPATAMAAATPPELCCSIRDGLMLGAQSIGVAAAIFALIVSSRGVYRIVTPTPQPAPAPAAIASVQIDAPDPPPAPRRPVKAARTGAIETHISNGDELTEPRGRAGVG